MKAIITGANGFLGNNITRKFLSNGAEVMAISLHTDRLNDIIGDIQFSCCSMNRISSLESRIIEFKPDVIIHAAWDGGNNYLSTQSPNQFYNNLPGLIDLLTIINRANVPHFVGIGSGAEYGNYNTTITEEYREIPLSLYGVSKLSAKMYVEQFCKLENIKWTWLRPFYTYGPGDVETRLIPRTIISCLKKEEVPLNECDSMVDYLYIDDFVSAVMASINFKKSNIFNVCSGNKYSVRQIVKLIGELTDNVNNLNFGALPERTHQPSTIIGSSDRLQLCSKWKPSTSLEEGLSKTIEFYKKI